MQMTHEGPRFRWAGLVAAWLLLAIPLFLHADGFARYVARLDAVGLRGAAEPSTPLKRTCPTMYADTQMWVRHAIALAEGAGPQLRSTQVDNAPEGREVHWNSGFAWLLAGIGWVRHAMTGEPLAQAIEQSLAWFNVPFMLFFVVLLSSWAARRAGLGAGLLVAFGMVGNPSFYTGFFPNYVDHHGLLALSTFGLLLGGVFMGSGFLRTVNDPAQILPGSINDVRAGAVLSAISGAVGMWVSAATTIPAIVIMGIAGVATIAVHGAKRGEGVALDAGMWRLWGRWGGGLSLAFYVFEYAPLHLGMRLEVNHPLYALGWWAGSEFIAAFAEWRHAGVNVLKLHRGRLILAAACLAIVPAIIVLAGERVFVVFDPFISRLTRFVAEGISLPKSASFFGWYRVMWEITWAILTAIIAIIALIKSRRHDRPLLVFSFVAFLIFAVMGFAQIRWLPSLSGAEICLVVVSISSLAAGRRPLVRWAWITAVLLLLCTPPLADKVRHQLVANRSRVVDRMDVIQPIYRDIAAALRATQPTGDIVLLSNPNASTAIGYYGQFKTIGTLYWENLAGTKAAAEMFSAQSETEARKLIRARGVTHVAMISTENFLKEYFGLLHPNPEGISFEKSFGYQLLAQQQVPIWLEAIPYAMPTDVPGRPERVLLFKTRFGNPRAESLYEAALIDIDAGRLAEAEPKLDAALAIEPHSAPFLLIKGRLLLTRRDFPGAIEAIMSAIDHSDLNRKFGLCSSEASRFYQAGAHPEAKLLFRRALQINADATTANNLAWLMATSTNPSVRNGAEALKIVEQLVPTHRDYVFIATYAAALAECGRFADAAQVMTQALALARSSMGPQVVAACEKRLAAYQQGRAIYE